MSVLYCSRCQQEVVIMGVSLGAVCDEDLETFREEMTKEGKIVLFNPPPVGPHHCPRCGATLDEFENGNPNFYASRHNTSQQ